MSYFELIEDNFHSKKIVIYQTNFCLQHLKYFYCYFLQKLTSTVSLLFRLHYLFISMDYHPLTRCNTNLATHDISEISVTSKSLYQMNNYSFEVQFNIDSS